MLGKDCFAGRSNEPRVVPTRPPPYRASAHPGLNKRCARTFGSCESLREQMGANEFAVLACQLAVAIFTPFGCHYTTGELARPRLSDGIDCLRPRVFRRGSAA